MNILIISNLFPPAVLGGYEILCGQVVHTLIARGHTVTVLTSNHGGFSSTDRVIRTLKLFHPFESPVRGAMRREKQQTGRENARIVKQLVGTGKFDLIFMWSMLRLSVGPALAAERSAIPVVYTFNDEHPAGYLPAKFDWKPAQMIRWAMELSLMRSITNRSLTFQYSTCISELLKRNLLRSGMPIERSRVIYQGIPLERFPLKPYEAVPDDREVRILYAGQLHDYKGVHTLLEAIELLQESRPSCRCRCTIVGTGSDLYLHRLREMAEKLESPVEFRGVVAHESMPEVYREHDLFVFPSIWAEPFGLTHLEAMASGLPVVSTVCGGQGEFLREGENCLTFEPENAEQLSQQLARIIHDRTLFRNLTVSGRETVEQQFSFSRYVDELLELLQDARDRRPL